MVMDFKLAPYTGGKGYTIVDEDMFEQLTQTAERNQIDFRDIEKGGHYLLVRLCRDEEGNSLRMVIEIRIVDMQFGKSDADSYILFAHNGGLKTFHLLDFKRVWNIIPIEVSLGQFPL